MPLPSLTLFKTPATIRRKSRLLPKAKYLTRPEPHLLLQPLLKLVCPSLSSSRHSDLLSLPWWSHILFLFRNFYLLLTVSWTFQPLLSKWLVLPHFSDCAESQFLSKTFWVCFAKLDRSPHPTPTTPTPARLQPQCLLLIQFPVHNEP